MWCPLNILRESKNVFLYLINEWFSQIKQVSINIILTLYIKKEGMK